MGVPTSEIDSMPFHR